MHEGQDESQFLSLRLKGKEMQCPKPPQAEADRNAKDRR